MTFDDCRHEVKAFALLMEAKLRRNDGKGGWKEEHTAYLSRRCGNELAELRDVLAKLRRERQKGFPPVRKETIPALIQLVGSEAADVANFAMMIADVCGALASATAKPSTGEP